MCSRACTRHTLTVSLSSDAGMIPTAISVPVFAIQYDLSPHVFIAATILSTVLAAPIMFVSAEVSVLLCA